MEGKYSVKLKLKLLKKCLKLDFDFDLADLGRKGYYGGTRYWIVLSRQRQYHALKILVLTILINNAFFSRFICLATSTSESLKMYVVERKAFTYYL